MDHWFHSGSKNSKSRLVQGSKRNEPALRTASCVRPTVQFVTSRSWTFEDYRYITVSSFISRNVVVAYRCVATHAVRPEVDLAVDHENLTDPSPTPPTSPPLKTTHRFPRLASLTRRRVVRRLERHRRRAGVFRLAGGRASGTGARRVHRGRGRRGTMAPVESARPSDETAPAPERAVPGARDIRVERDGRRVPRRADTPVRGVDAETRRAAGRPGQTPDVSRTVRPLQPGEGAGTVSDTRR